jgi:EmrB/QacA subfamily drug resistance transporter
MNSGTDTTKKPPYFMIIIMMIGSFIAILNNSLMNNALPTIMSDFDIKEYSTVQWLTTGYMLVLGVLIPTSAYFITKFSNRSIFITSMTIFSIGTILAIFANEFYILLAGRLIQGAGAALLSPLLMNVMISVFSKKQRGMAMGIYGLIIIVAPALGPTISGYLLEHFSWRALFIFIAPIALVALALSIFKLENVLEQKEANLDVASLVLSTAGFSFLLYGVSSASSKGWDAFSVYGLIIIGVLALILFSIRQLKIENPLINVRVFKYPMYALGSVVSVINSIILYSAMMLLPFYFQQVQEFEPMKAGIILLPGSLLMGLFMPIAGKIYDKVGIKPLALSGLVMVGASLIALSQLTITTGLFYTIAWFSVFSIGVALLTMPIQTNSLNQLPPELNSSGVAVNSTLLQVAGAVGSAIFITIMTTFAKTRGEELFEITKEKLGAKLASYTPDQLAVLQHDITQQAKLEAINHTMQFGLIFVVVAFVLSLFLRKGQQEVE